MPVHLLATACAGPGRATQYRLCGCCRRASCCRAGTPHRTSRHHRALPPSPRSPGDRDDTLVEMSFFVPRENQDFEAHAPAPAAGEEGEAAPPVDPPSKIFFDLVSQYTDQGAATGDAVATFDQVGVLVPRGRFDIEMYMASLKLVGQVSRHARRRCLEQGRSQGPRGSRQTTLAALCCTHKPAVSNPPQRPAQPSRALLRCARCASPHRPRTSASATTPSCASSCCPRPTCRRRWWSSRWTRPSARATPSTSTSCARWAEGGGASSWPCGPR
jgi:hypothetical protein